MAEDVLVLAELADPWLARWVVEIGVLLLDTAFSGGILVQLGGTTAWLPWRGCLLLLLLLLLLWWWWGAGWPTCSAIGKGRGRVCTCTIHVWAGLRALGRHHRSVWADGRAGAGRLSVWRRSRSSARVGAWGLGVLAIFLARPDHLVGRIGAARESELCLVRALLCSFLLQQTHVFVAVGWRGGLGVGNGSRDDAALLRGS